VIAIQRNRDIPIYPNTLLDRFGLLLAEKHSLPGKNVFGFVEIAIGNERQPLQPDRIEDIIPIRHFPSIQ
jgi:hypothetical protein